MGRRLKYYDPKSQLSPIGRSVEQPFGIQHPFEDYTSPGYLSPERLSSYSIQFNLAIKTNTRSFLNIGSANNFLKTLITNKRLKIINIDLDFETNPDITAALPSLPLDNGAVESILCFQVIEHLPFNLIDQLLIEMKRVAEKYIIISLPDRSLTPGEVNKYRFFKITGRPKEWRKYKPRDVDPEHFWEIGYKEISAKDIIKIGDQIHLECLEHFRNRLNPYHHFFVFKI